MSKAKLKTKQGYISRIGNLVELASFDLSENYESVNLGGIYFESSTGKYFYIRSYDTFDRWCDEYTEESFQTLSELLRNCIPLNDRDEACDFDTFRDAAEQSAVKAVNMGII